MSGGWKRKQESGPGFRAENPRLGISYFELIIGIPGSDSEAKLRIFFVKPCTLISELKHRFWNIYIFPKYKNN